MKWIRMTLAAATTTLAALVVGGCALSDLRPDGMTLGYGHTWFGGSETDINGTNRIVTRNAGNDIVYVSVSYRFGESEYAQRGRFGPWGPTAVAEDPLDRLPVPGRTFEDSEGAVAGVDPPDLLDGLSEPLEEETVQGVDPDGEAEAEVDIHEEVEWFDGLGLVTQLSALAIVLTILVVYRVWFGSLLGRVITRIFGRDGGGGSEK